MQKYTMSDREPGGKRRKRGNSLRSEATRPDWLDRVSMDWSYPDRDQTDQLSFLQGRQRRQEDELTIEYYSWAFGVSLEQAEEEMEEYRRKLEEREKEEEDNTPGHHLGDNTSAKREDWELE